MASHTIRFYLALFVWSHVVAFGHGQEPKEDSSAAIDELVPGDQYVVMVERQGVKQSYTGDLIKANDDWLVLAQRMEARNEYGVPIASKLPYAKRLFKNVRVARWDVQLWILREATRIQGRIRAAEAATVMLSAGESPVQKSDCTVEVVRAGKSSEDQGTLTALGDGELTLSSVRVETTKTAVPVLGELPLLGRAFTRRFETTHQIEKRHSLDEVLCIRIKADVKLQTE